MKFPAKTALFSTRYRAYAYIVGAVFLWSLATIVVRFTVAYVPPLTFLMIRFWMASILLIPLGYYYYRTVHLSRTRIRYILTYGLLATVFPLTLTFFALERTIASDGALLYSIYPLLMSALGYYLLREIIRKRELEGTLIAFIGALIVIVDPIISGILKIDGSIMKFLGNILMAGGILFDAVGTIFQKKRITHDTVITPLMLIVYSFLFAMVAFSILGPIEQYVRYRGTNDGKLPTCTQDTYDRAVYVKKFTCDQTYCVSGVSGEPFCMNKEKRTGFPRYFGQQVAQALRWPQIAGIMYMAFFSGIIAYTLFAKGLRHIEASEASLFQYLEPVISIPLAILLLGEKVTFIFIIGAILIIIGIYRAEKR